METNALAALASTSAAALQALFIMKILNLSLGCVVFMACCSWTSSGVIVREYNEIFRKDLHSLAEFEETYMTHYNEDKSIHTTNANILLGVAEPQVRLLAPLAHCFHLCQTTLILRNILTAHGLFPKLLRNPSDSNDVRSAKIN